MNLDFFRESFELSQPMCQRHSGHFTALKYLLSLSLKGTENTQRPAAFFP